MKNVLGKQAGRLLVMATVAASCASLGERSSTEADLRAAECAIYEAVSRVPELTAPMYVRDSTITGGPSAETFAVWLTPHNVRPATIQNLFEVKDAVRAVCAVFPSGYAPRLVSASEMAAMPKTTDMAEYRRHFERAFPGVRSVLSFSRIGFSPDRTEAVLSVSSTCGPLCGRSEVVLVRLIDGRWQVVHRAVWVMT